MTWPREDVGGSPVRLLVILGLTFSIGTLACSTVQVRPRACGSDGLTSWRVPIVRLEAECDSCQVEWEGHGSDGIEVVSGRWYKLVNAPVGCSVVYLGAFPEREDAVVKRIRILVDRRVAGERRDAAPGRELELEVTVGRC